MQYGYIFLAFFFVNVFLFFSVIRYIKGQHNVAMLRIHQNHNLELCRIRRELESSLLAIRQMTVALDQVRTKTDKIPPVVARILAQIEEKRAAGSQSAHAVH